MTEYLIGTGGWAYFPSEDKMKLRTYSQVFNFVEVNDTFYEYPSTRRVEQWRRSVPANFTFSVRCHQDITHRIGLKPVEEAYLGLDQILTYCKILKAPFLVVETPASYVFSNEVVAEARELLSSANSRDVRFVWETRSLPTTQAMTMMQDLNIVHSTDLSKEMPLFPSDVIYTRLFGKGKHNIYQFTDEELLEIDRRILFSKAKTASLSYHGVRMNTDALRFQSYRKSGKFPSITGFTGIAAAKSVLAEDIKFPASRQALIEKQGWKVFDLTEEKRLRLSDWLAKIPDKVYSSMNEVESALEAVVQ